MAYRRSVQAYLRCLQAPEHVRETKWSHPPFAHAHAHATASPIHLDLSFADRSAMTFRTSKSSRSRMGMSVATNDSSGSHRKSRASLKEVTISVPSELHPKQMYPLTLTSDQYITMHSAHKRFPAWCWGRTRCQRVCLYDGYLEKKLDLCPRKADEQKTRSTFEGVPGILKILAVSSCFLSV